MQQWGSERIVDPMKRRKRIYLDMCCLNRPFDDQEQERVRMEAEAVKSVLLQIGTGQWTGISSEMIEFELRRMPDPDRRLEVTAIVADFAEFVAVGESERRRGAELERLGFEAADALHIACAEQAEADVFLTTDDALLRRAARVRPTLAMHVANPLTWQEEMLRA